MVNFEEQVQAWSSPPVDDIGYIPSSDLLAKTGGELLDIISQMRAIRYSTEGWRNRDNAWRDDLLLDDTEGKIVLDFGCGVGMEALEYARHGNAVAIADISPTNLLLAARVFALHDETLYDILQVGPSYPYAPVAAEIYDVVHCSGVLHHIPWAQDVLHWFHEILIPGGEVRLMLYSDRGWQLYMGSEPPADVTQHGQFHQFVRTFDQVGGYADWYDEQKLVTMAGDRFELVAFSYITDNDRYCIARLKRRELT